MTQREFELILQRDVAAAVALIAVLLALLR